MEKKDDTLTMERKNTISKIKDILHQISNSYLGNEKISHKLEENKVKIDDLSKEISVLKDEYETEKQNLQSKIREYEEHNYLLKNLKEDKVNAEVVLRDLETKHKTLKKTKPSLRDEQILERGKRKHKLYKEFTGIRWDYSVPENVIEGYITNKKDFIQPISYKEDVDYKTLKELLWKDIKKSTISINSIIREESKENISNNIS